MTHPVVCPHCQQALPTGMWLHPADGSVMPELFNPLERGNPPADWELPVDDGLPELWEPPVAAGVRP